MKKRNQTRKKYLKVCGSIGISQYREVRLGVSLMTGEGISWLHIIRIKRTSLCVCVLFVCLSISMEVLSPQTRQSNLLISLCRRGWIPLGESLNMVQTSIKLRLYLANQSLQDWTSLNLYCHGAAMRIMIQTILGLKS